MWCILHEVIKIKISFNHTGRKIRFSPNHENQSVTHVMYKQQNVISKQQSTPSNF